MNCAEFEEVLHDLDRAGTPGLKQREEALAHAQACPRCALLMIEAESLDLGLHEISFEDGGKQATPLVETTLRREFRRQKAIVIRRRVRWQIAAIAAAAMVLLAVGISVRDRITTKPQPAGGSPALANTAQTLPPRGTPTSEASNGLESQQTSEQAQSDEEEYATAFVPLPFADDPDAVEDGAIVRVMLTRSALASLGLPALGPGGSDEIPADLVLNDDGTPEAIRLVSQAEIQ
jgi:hypothetical protein